MHCKAFYPMLFTLPPTGSEESGWRGTMAGDAQLHQGFCLPAVWRRYQGGCSLPMYIWVHGIWLVEQSTCLAVQPAQKRRCVIDKIKCGPACISRHCFHVIFVSLKKRLTCRRTVQDAIVSQGCALRREPLLTRDMVMIMRLIYSQLTTSISPVVRTFRIPAAVGCAEEGSERIDCKRLRRWNAAISDKESKGRETNGERKKAWGKHFRRRKQSYHKCEGKVVTSAICGMATSRFQRQLNDVGKRKAKLSLFSAGKGEG
jgi:hypothetical protein